MSRLTGAFDGESSRGAAAAALESIDDAVVDVEPIDRGRRKQTALARFANRGPVVVQVCAERTWLRTEAALLSAVRRRTFVPVPPVLAAGAHDGVAYMLTAYVAGDDLHEAFVSIGEGARRDLARWFGAALARLHEAFRFDGHGRLELSDGALASDGRDWGPWFRDYGRRAIDRLPPAFDALRDDLRAVVAAESDGEPDARLFPWDFRPGNALVAGDSVTAVVDWEAPLAAAPALSVAKSEYLVADWYVADSEPLRQAFREGYGDVRPLPAVRPAHRIAAIAESAVDSGGEVTNPRYPPVGRSDAIAFHRDALAAVMTDT
ncbi:putative aminoglycoside phosphotransferase [Halapricum desulfuricans]|uniref:Putative aminoglycoside phosphotransferase n=1 Tax=Halapricum desulfuricans TaxID=2841257 RepID=A0A897NKQ1_9EURY|nr:phosphotransferase [Halapricum desulfuricans]QSG13238.1 putative aminoglycoside phosphotransferase [Halapricum desulfuricans]